MAEIENIEFLKTNQETGKSSLELEPSDMAIIIKQSGASGAAFPATGMTCEFGAYVLCAFACLQEQDQELIDLLKDRMDKNPAGFCFGFPQVN